MSTPATLLPDRAARKHEPDTRCGAAGCPRSACRYRRYGVLKSSARAAGRFATAVLAVAGFVLVFLGAPLLATAGELKPFTTDGCSVFPDGTPEHRSLWVECCIRHDLAYWQGGTYDERLHADRELESCVAGVGEPKLAAVMLAGVRVGGSPYFPTGYRWGYGWPFLRGYKPLNEAEKQQVNQRIEQFKLIINSIRNELP